MKRCKHHIKIKPVKPKPSRKRKTISYDEFKRMCFTNSGKLPRLVEIDGKDYCWVGIGLVCHGEASGQAVLVQE